MARARGINPSIMDNEDLAELSPLTRLLFIYLWMLADREGRLEDRPKRIAAQALSYDRSADVEVMLTELVSAGFISRYSAAGVKCISILSFNRHQRPHGTEKDSRLPSETGEFSVHTRGKNGYSTGDVTLVNSLLTVKKLSDNALTPDPCLLTPDQKTLVDFADEQDNFNCPEEILLPTNDAERAMQQHAVLVHPSKPKQESVACPQDALLDLYEAHLPDLAQPRKSLWKDGKNAPSLKARWDWVMTACHESGSRKGERMAITQEDGLNWFDRFFGYVAKSDYLTGQKNDFAANLIWLVNKANFEKVISGNYENKEKAA